MRLVLGKALCYLMLYALVSVWVLIVVPQLFHLAQIPQASDLLAFMVPYLLACIFFAMTCSILVYQRETCMLIFVFTSLPLLFISGISWPGVAVPDFWKYVSWLAPSTFGINGFVPYQYDGGFIGGCDIRVCRPVDSGWNIFLDGLCGLLLHDRREPENRE